MKKNKENLRIAVVIAFYNGSKWVEKAIASALNQTYPATQVIVVNDGSKEEERAALYEIQKKMNFTIIDKENGGQGSARNVGVESADVDFVCFLDQDDFYIDKHIEILVKAMPMNDSRFGYVYGDCMEADGDGNIVRTSMIKEHSSHPKKNIFDLIRNDMFILPSAAMVSKKAFSDVGGFDVQFTGYEDDDLFMRFFRAGYNSYFVDASVYVWCINTESTSYSIRMSKSRIKYFKKLSNTFTDDYLRGRFYFRDLLVPRFGPLVVGDLVKNVIKNGSYKKDLLDILKEYKSIVWSNEYVSYSYKIKLSVFYYVFSIFPDSILKFNYLFCRLMFSDKFIRRMRGMF